MLSAEIDRRHLLRGLVAYPGLALAVQETAQPLLPLKGQPARIKLTPSGPIVSRARGETIEGLDIGLGSDAGITIHHDDVTVRNCRIRHGYHHGIAAMGVHGLKLENLEVERVDLPTERPPPARESDNLNLTACPGVVVASVKASGGSANIYVEDCPAARLRVLELHDARGPDPRGQNVQFNASPASNCEFFSAENGPSSWTEDNISVYRSDHCLVRNGLVFYNNSPTGSGVMIEGSSTCLVLDVDAVQQGNGAFGAVPMDNVACGGCWFVRCRTRDSYNSPRDGRAPPTSNGLSFYMGISAGAPQHVIAACHYDALANPHNLIWKKDAVRPGWSLTRRAFAPHRPLRLVFGW